VTDPLRVVVTGVGAIIGQGIIRSLRRMTEPVWILGVDRSDQSPGPSMCDAFVKKPPCDESDLRYEEFWSTLLHDYAIDIVLPGLELDVFFLDQHRALVAQAGAALAINRPELIALSSDKWAMGEALRSHGLPSIPATLTTDWQEAQRILGPPPLLLKPRRGNGSRGIVRLNDEFDFAYWRGKSADNCMLQRIIGKDDEEYTVGAFGLGYGRTLAPIVFRRRLSPAGNTQFAEVVHDSEIVETTRVLCERFHPVGPTNLQFRKESGVCYLLEINPRLSSSTSLRSAFGYNESVMSIEFFLRMSDPDSPSIRAGKGWRYSEDFVVYDGDPS
jgi:carbamoyl-phosphate synthase large subunit